MTRLRGIRYSMNFPATPLVISTISALLIDAFLAVLTLGWALSFLTYPQHDWCRNGESDYRLPINHCLQWSRALYVTLWIATGFVAIVGYAFLLNGPFDLQ
jgi:hypothetical protein